MCESMRWNHLPVAGGLYDQHPELLSQWQIIWEEKARYEEKKAEKERRLAPKPPNIKGH